MSSDDPRFEALLDYLKGTRGFDFTAYKRSSLMRRIQKRLQSIGIESYDGYQAYLETHSEEFGIEPFRRRVKIYASDVDDEALMQARHATYTASQVEDVPPELLSKYFERVDDRYLFHKDIRRSIIFGRHDLVQDAPISRVNLLVCRNTLMYFTRETQAKVLNRFHFALRNGGFLFMGRAELLLTHGELFTPVELKWRVFSKTVAQNVRDAEQPTREEERAP